jgi:enediyne biosynthesis protein E4
MHSAAFCDLDGDGNLDLYVVNYVDWSPEEAPCFSSGENPVRLVCSPTARTGQPDVLFRNLGQREFEEIGASAGIAIAEEGKGLAVAIADLNSDHRPDIYVANDTTPNFLFQNQGGMKFRNVGVAHGVSCSDTGEVGAGMGVSAADIDRDGRLDLCVTNFRHQVDDIFLNIGDSGFVTANAELGVDRVSRMKLGFGIILQDFDLDGWPDLFVANGHIWDLSAVNELSTYQMLPTLLHNRQGHRFADVARDARPYFQASHLGRAVAAGDLDNDGDIDLVVTQLIEGAAILRNDSQPVGRVLRIRLIGRTSARQPLGMRVEVYCGPNRYVSCVPSGQSFQASHDERLCIAVGDAPTVDRVSVFWGDGQVESWFDLPVDADLSLVESTGTSQRQDR